MYSGLEAYENSDDKVALVGAQNLAKFMYEFDDDFEKNLPENKFLLKYGFINDDLRPINKDGKLIDWEGRLIDEEGRYLDNDGNYVDIDGNPVTEEGEPVVEFSPFLDDDGKPVVDDVGEPEPKSEKIAPAKKAAPKKADSK